MSNQSSEEVMANETQKWLPQASPDAQNPEIGFGDVMKFLQALTEAVMTGQTERPAITLKIAGMFTLRW